MPYFYQQKFNLNDLPVSEFRHKVLMLTPHYDLFQLYKSYLEEYGLKAYHCADPALSADYFRLHEPRVILVELGDSGASGSHHKILSRIRLIAPEACVVTIGTNTEGELIKQYLGAGVTHHINRLFTRPKDVAIIINGIVSSYV